MRILITGATGFIGGALAADLASAPTHHVRIAVRNPNRRADAPQHVELVTVGDLTPQTDWRTGLSDVDVVIHCAARVHVMNETALDPLAEFRRVNVEGTLNLAQQAQEAGVKRFIFISSIKVNGEETSSKQPFHADDAPAPADPYGISKFEAEQALMRLSSQGTMELVIVRPVLVYGPGVKANFQSMMRWLRKGIPLPLGGIRANRRSLVAIDNLVDLIKICMTHPKASGNVFLVSDGEDLSTTGLLRRTAQAMGKSAILLPVPAGLLQWAARLLGRPGVAQRLCGSLRVDIGKNREILGWTPPIAVDDALKKTVAAYLRGN